MNEQTAKGTSHRTGFRSPKISGYVAVVAYCVVLAALPGLIAAHLYVLLLLIMLGVASCIVFGFSGIRLAFKIPLLVCMTLLMLFATFRVFELRGFF